MCEIHFVKPIGRKINKRDLDELMKIMRISAETNDDGFGLFNEKGVIFKRGEKFSKKYKQKIYDLYLGSEWVVAHNRLATHGEPKKINSHPFKNSKWVWVHNGIIQNHKLIEAEFGLRFNVDSEIIGKLALKLCS